MPHLALVFAASVWGSAPAAIKFVLAAIPLFDAVSFRFLLATAALWLAALIAGRLGRVRQVGWQPFLAGMVDPGVIAVLVYHGVQMTTAIHTSVIFALMPIVSTVFGRAVLKEAISVPVVLGAGVAIAGIAVLVSSKTATGEPTLAGDLVIVGCVFIVCAAQLVLRKVARDHGEPIVATASMMSGATTTGFVAWLVFADDHSLTWAATAPADVWIVFLYAALVISAGCSSFTTTLSTTCRSGARASTACSKGRPASSSPGSSWARSRRSRRASASGSRSRAWPSRA